VTQTFVRDLLLYSLSVWEKGSRFSKEKGFNKSALPMLKIERVAPMPSARVNRYLAGCFFQRPFSFLLITKRN